MAALDGLLSSRDYVVGDRFTAADVYLGAHIGWGMQFGTVEKRAAFERYWQRVSNRPAAIRAKEIDDKLTPVQSIPASGA
jgi:glutathione S-transferase